MKRREFILTASAATVLWPSVGLAEALRYKNGLVDDLLAEGKTVFIDFKTDWCSTCAAQGRKIAELKSENPAYEQAVTFVDVDYDKHGNGPLANRLRIPRRSTLVVLKGDQELGRIVAGTAKSEIKALMDTALNAAIA